MASPITRDELYDKITRGERFYLFEVLAKMYWRKHHLPGAINLPPDQVTTLVPQLVTDRAAEIVLYCWDDDCPTSGWAAGQLAELGYTNVREYPGGKKEW